LDSILVTHRPNNWAWRFALLAAVSAVPLVLFGGSVTTLGAGMAVDGWLVAEGHFLLLFPVESWFRDTATFVEHSHRLFGVLVGLFSVAAVVASFASRRTDALARSLAVAALLLVCGQGALGGFRVLENAPQLAFLHGAAAQAVFAVLCASALVQTRAFKDGPDRTGEGERAGLGLRVLALAATLAVYAQVVLGAWYRHALRPTPSAEAGQRFLWHALLAIGVTFLLFVLISALKRTGGEALTRCARRLTLLVGLQIGLGLLAWASYQPGAVGPFEWALSILHVLCGGLLLAQTLATWMWTERLRAVALQPSAAKRIVAREVR
jgi:cytochrome c oxidase assembly protein subunit 15